MGRHSQGIDVKNFIDSDNKENGVSHRKGSERSYGRGKVAIASILAGGALFAAGCGNNSESASPEAAAISAPQDSNEVPQEGWNMFRYGATEYDQTYGGRADEFNFGRGYDLQNTPDSIAGFKDHHMKVVEGNSALA
ncbi:MAG: hypothetical protein AAB834_02935, partial [Patescibacteria group bacterium]